MEGLKGAIHLGLKKIETPKAERNATRAQVADGTRLVYLICDERDRKATIPVRKFLKAQGFDVDIPAFEGDAAKVRAANQKLLTTCDAIIVFYGAGDEAWKRTIDSELKKMNGYRTGPAILASYTILAEPKTSDKEELLELEEPNLINALSGFSEDEMAVFVNAVEAAGRRS